MLNECVSTNDAAGYIKTRYGSECNEWIDERELVIERRWKIMEALGVWMRCSSMLEGALRVRQMHWVASICSPILGEFEGVGGSGISGSNWFNYRHR